MSVTTSVNRRVSAAGPLALAVAALGMGASACLCGEGSDPVSDGLAKLDAAMRMEPVLTGLGLDGSGGQRPADVALEELLPLWKAVPDDPTPPHLQDEAVALPRIVRAFAAAGKPTAQARCEEQLWFGIERDRPATGKPDGGWHLLRIARPEGSVDARHVDALKASGKIDAAGISDCAVFHERLHTGDSAGAPVWDCIGKLVAGQPIADDDPVLKALRELSASSAALLATRGDSSVVVHWQSTVLDPSLDGKEKPRNPLFLRQDGARMYGIQPAKTGDPQLPFENVAGNYFEFWRVR
jgi:hypothetical protein